MPFACAWSKVWKKLVCTSMPPWGSSRKLWTSPSRWVGHGGVVCNVRGAVMSGVKITAKVWVWFIIANYIPSRKKDNIYINN